MCFWDGTSVDESWAPYIGLFGKRTRCTHICSHAHFLHTPPWYPSHTHSFLFPLPPTLQHHHTTPPHHTTPLLPLTSPPPPLSELDASLSQTLQTFRTFSRSQNRGPTHIVSLLLPHPFHTAHKVLRTSLLFTEEGWQPWGGVALSFLSLAEGGFRSSLPNTEELLLGCVCVCDQSHRCLFSRLCFDVFCAKFL